MMEITYLKKIDGYIIGQVTIDELTPENVGMILVITPNKREYPVNSVEEGEYFIREVFKRDRTDSKAKE